MFIKKCIIGLSVGLVAASTWAGAVKDTIDWKSFLKRQDVVWEKLPERFDHGIYHGNGMLGLMIYQDQPNRFRWELGRSDVTAHRRDNHRMPIGGLVLNTVGTIESGNARLDLWNAESTGTIKTDKGSISFKNITHADEMVSVIELTASGDELDSTLALKPAEPVDFVNRKYKAVVKKYPEFAKDKPNPQPVIENRGPIMLCRQGRFAGGEYVTAWQVVQIDENTRRIYVTVNDTFPAVNADVEAVANIQKAVSGDYSNFVQRHREWWHSFFPKSFISVPDPKVESFYWAQIYKMGCVTRSDRMPIDLLGPWFRRTAWPRIWWNLNVQIAYLPFYTSNHLDLAESFTKMIDRNYKNFQYNAKELYGVIDGATVPHTTDYNGLRGDGSRAPEYFINPGDFTWALNNYYLQYRYTMDHSFITDREKHRFFDSLRGTVNVYRHIIIKGDDGLLHLPVLHSPEYGKFADNNYNLSLLRWACKTLLKLADRYQIEDPLIPEWKNILEKLVPYAQGETGVLVGKDGPLMRSHRHWSHLMMAFPLYDEEWISDENNEVLRKSIIRWLTIDNAKGIKGWSHAGAATFYAFLRNGNLAHKSLHNHHDSEQFVMPNAMYIEDYPVIECALFAGKALHDMQLQSWGDTIRIFPAIPDAWQDTVFHNLRTEGAFLVSAKREKGATSWIRIKSLAGEPCKVDTGMTGTLQVVQDGVTRVIAESNGILTLDLKKGEEAVILKTGDRPDMIVKAIPMDPTKANYWGVKK